jgi:SAM-dependent methyltransferase
MYEFGYKKAGSYCFHFAKPAKERPKIDLMNKQSHWENIYSTKQPTEVSWFTPHLESSLKLIGSAGLRTDASIIDIGCGASTLVDDLLDRGFTDISCLEISGGAVETTKKRLGERASHVL